MRSIGVLTVLLGALFLASSCSDGSNTSPPDNTAPVANFDVPQCSAGVACNFSSTSTDDAAVTAWSWDFDGDGHADATTADASFTYPAAADYTVSLTVKDAEGLSNTKTATITVAPPGNQAPVANFDVPQCFANVPCNFTSTSTDDAAVTAWSWDFDGNATPDATTETAAWTFTAEGTFNVSLTVQDAEGLSNTKTQPVTVGPQPPNTPPTAGFTFSCASTVCNFTNTSTDAAPGTIATYAWTFGDGGTGNVANPIHNYAITVAKDFSVTLTVTDNEGATASVTQTVSVSPPPPAAEGCVTSGSNTLCTLNISAQSNVRLKLVGISCDLNGEAITIPPPIGDQIFLGVCLRQVGDSSKIYGGPQDLAIIYEPGSQAVIKFKQGTAGIHDPTPGPPAAHLSGTFPAWTINYEDGANPGGAGEPDFTDLVVEVTAFPPTPH
jgi:PKD repeat protein